MFKQVFRLTFVTFIWKHYKRLIVSTALLFAYLWFVGYAHAEYLQYANQDQNVSVGQSFFIKWIALILGVAVYLLFHFLSPSRKQKKESAKPIEAHEPKPGEPDPFDAIREKDSLRSRAEIVLDKTKSD